MIQFILGAIGVVLISEATKPKAKEMARGGGLKEDYNVVVKMPSKIVVKKDFEGFSKQEIIDWCEERGWKYNKKGESLGSRVLKDYEFYLIPFKRKEIILPKKEAKSRLMANGGEVRRRVIEEDDYEDDYDEEEVYKKNYGDKYDFIDINEFKEGGLMIGEYLVLGELMFFDSPQDSLNVYKYVIAKNEDDAINKVKKMYLNVAPDSRLFAELVDRYE